MVEKKVVAVVVTYNRKVLLKECLIALMEQDYKNLKVLVVDNASTDGTQEYINDLVDNITIYYYNTGKNLGGSGGFNIGIKEAMKMNSDYIWIMDDDCIVQKDSLTELVKFAKEKNDNFGFLSSKVNWKDGSICKMNVQRLGVKRLVEDFDISGQKIKLASFVSLFLKPSVVEEVGLPLKDFFIWGDDWEYTYRISKQFDSYYVASSEVIHKSVMNIGSDISKDSYDKLNRYFYAYRNESYFYRQVGLKGKIYHKLKIALHFLRIMLTKIDHKRERIKTMFRGLKASKSFYPEIEYVYSASNKKIKVLEFFGEPLSYGGQEAFMLNMYRNFEKPNIKYTLATPFYTDNKNLIELANKRHDEIISGNFKFDSKLRKRYIKKFAKNLLINNSYDVIHIQSGSIFTLLNVAKIARKAGVRKIIVHSHATGNNNLKYKLIKRYSDKRIDKYVDKYFACSDLAAKWKFPKEIIDSKKYTIINNGVDVQKFKFDEEVRKQYREEFSLGDSITFCHVGRFSPEKNHEFLVELAPLLRERLSNFKFFLVGAGDLKEEIVNKIKELELIEHFILLENRNDINNIMMASDIFLMPSLYEGFPVTMVEAQAVGLKAICSNTITSEASFTDLTSFLALDDKESWIKTIVLIKHKVVEREKYSQLVSKAGYNAKQSAEMLENIYTNS